MEHKRFKIRSDNYIWTTTINSIHSKEIDSLPVDVRTKKVIDSNTNAHIHTLSLHYLGLMIYGFNIVSQKKKKKFDFHISSSMKEKIWRQLL